MTKEEKKAIVSLERAFKKCHNLGIMFSGMDDNIYFATSSILKENRKQWLSTQDGDGQYCEVAYVQNYDSDGERTGRVKADSYQDSGGW